MSSRLLIALSVLFILFATFSFWVSKNIYNPENFKNNVLTAFKKQETRDVIASEVVDRISADNPALKQIASSPAESAISGMLNSSYLEPVIEKVSERLQRYITTGQQEVSIDLSPVNTLLSAVAKATGNTDQTPQIKNSEVVILPANAFPKFNKWLKPITTAGPILGFVGVGILAYVVYRRESRILAIKTIGIYLLVGVILNLLLLPFVSSLIQQNAPNGNVGVIATETFDTFAGSYFYLLLILLAISLLLIFTPFFFAEYERLRLKRRSSITKESNK